MGKLSQPSSAPRWRCYNITRWSRSMSDRLHCDSRSEWQTVTSNTPWTNQEVIKVNRAQLPTAWVSSSQEMEMGFATPPSSWALTSTTWSRDGHPGPATTPHLPEHPDTPEGQTWGLQTGHKGPLYPHHHSGFHAQFRLQIPNTSGWEEGQAGVLRWQWLSRRDLLYTSAQD